MSDGDFVNAKAGARSEGQEWGDYSPGIVGGRRPRAGHAQATRAGVDCMS